MIATPLITFAVLKYYCSLTILNGVLDKTNYKLEGLTCFMCSLTKVQSLRI